MDEQLYTGITSKSARRIQTDKEERKNQASRQRKEVLPTSDLLNVEFEKEIDKVMRVDNIQLDKLTNDFEIKATLLSQKMTVDSLRSIQTRLANLLRNNKDE